VILESRASIRFPIHVCGIELDGTTPTAWMNTSEITSMNRMFGLTFAMVLLFSLTSTLRAQDLSPGNGSQLDYGYAGSHYGEQPNGAFGLGYVQVPMVGSVLVDQYGGIHVAAPVMSTPTMQAPQPRSHITRSKSRKPAPQPRYALTTGSLYWPGAGQVILYSPVLRQQTYGGGYERSPYGSIDSGGMWHGWPLGY
jgi:hypothetical protein